jgi:hypothetical protein
MFIPDDPRLRAHALLIAEQRRHSLRRDDDGADPADEEREEPAEPPEREDQMSLFAAISAVSTGEETDVPAAAPGTPGVVGDEPDDLLLELAPPPPLAAPIPPGEDEGEPLRPRERRRRLRDANAALVRHISRITGLSHSQVNAELNRRVGVERVGEATLDQLERRRAQAARWLAAA